MLRLSNLKLELKNYRYVQLSFIPTVPGEDEIIIHEVLSVESEETRSGILLKLKLKNLETDEIYTYSYPDIIRIKEHDTDDSKFYIYSLDRGRLSSYVENDHRTLLKDIKTAEDLVNYPVPTLINRIIILKDYVPLN